MPSENVQYLSYLYRVQLDHDYGYTFVRLIVMPKNNPSEWETILFEPLAIYHETERALDQKELNSQTLAPPLLSFSFPGKEELRWHYTGIKAVIDFEIPRFFSSQLTDYSYTSDYDQKAWFFINKLGQEKLSITNYEQAKKYGIWRHLALPLIVTRISMIWMKRNGVDYHDLYKERLDNLHVRFIYNLTTYVYD